MQQSNDASGPVPLPRHSAALSALLQDVRGAIEGLSRTHHRLHSSLDAARKLDLLRQLLPILERGLPEPKWRFVQSRSIRYSKEIAQEQVALVRTSQQAVADWLPPLVQFSRYLREDRFNLDVVLLAKANVGLRKAAQAHPMDTHAAIGALDVFTAQLERLVAYLIRLQHAIYDELGNLADTRTDTTKKSGVRLPRRLEILRLIKLVEERDPAEKTMKDVALEFTDGNLKEAETLLRGMRRHLNRIKETEP